MLKLRSIILCIAAVGIIGCAAKGTPNYSSPYTKPRAGTVVQLKQELSVRNGVRIYLQDGYQLSWIELEKQEPYCQFYVHRSREELRQPLTIEPDTFVVEYVFRRKDSVAVEGMQVASEGEDVGGPWRAQRTMSTYMELSSEKQPKVTTLICAQWQDPYERNHVSVDEIIRSLGEIAEFIPPD